MTFSFPSCKDNLKSASRVSDRLNMIADTSLQDYCGSFGTSGLVSHTRHFHKHLAANPYFSPALPTEKPRFQHLVEGSVKVYIQTGTAEILYDEDVALAKAMHEEGVNVRLREVCCARPTREIYIELHIGSSSKARYMPPFCLSEPRRCAHLKRISPSFGIRSIKVKNLRTRT